MFKRKVKCLFFMSLSLVFLMSTFTSLTVFAKVRLSNKRITMEIRKTYTLKLKGAKFKKVRWLSSNKKIATVKKGVITAKKKGKCTVIAKYLGKKYKCIVHVTDSKSASSKPEISDQPVSSEPDTIETPSPSEKTEGAELSLEVNSFIQDTKVITYSIINKSDIAVSIPAFISLEKYNGKDWQAVKRKEMTVPASAMMVLPHDTIKMERDLNNDFADLDSGKYRLCIYTSYGTIYSENLIL